MGIILPKVGTEIRDQVLRRKTGLTEKEERSKDRYQEKNHLIKENRDFWDNIRMNGEYWEMTVVITVERQQNKLV